MAKPRSYKLQTYKAKDGYRWRIVAPNGRILADSGEAYTRRSTAMNAGKRLGEMLRSGFLVFL